MNSHHPSSDRSSFNRAEHSPASHGLMAHTRNNQIIYFGLITLATITLAIARALNPSAKGYGTHQQLGLPPCVFFKLTGIPCPSCGLTTSFAHATRLHLYQSLITQPFGLIACGLAVISIPLCAFLIWRRIAWKDAIGARGVHAMFYFLLVIYLLSWLYKIAAIKMWVSG